MVISHPALIQGSGGTPLMHLLAAIRGTDIRCIIPDVGAVWIHLRPGQNLWKVVADDGVSAHREFPQWIPYHIL